MSAETYRPDAHLVNPDFSFPFPERTHGFPRFTELRERDMPFWIEFTGNPKLPASEQPLSMEARNRYEVTAAELAKHGGPDHWQAVYVPTRLDFSKPNSYPGQTEPIPYEYYYHNRGDSHIFDSGIYFVNTTQQELRGNGSIEYKDDPLRELAKAVRDSRPNAPRIDIGSESRFGAVRDNLEYLEAIFLLEDMLGVDLHSDDESRFLNTYVLSHRIPQITANLLPEIYTTTSPWDHPEIGGTKDSSGQITYDKEASFHESKPLGFRPIVLIR